MSFSQTSETKISGLWTFLITPERTFSVLAWNHSAATCFHTDDVYLVILGLFESFSRYWCIVINYYLLIIIRYYLLTFINA